MHCKKEDFEYFGNEPNLSICNHIYEIDWLIAWVLIDKFHRLGYARGFVKGTIKFIPIWGWFFGLAGHIFLKRSFEKDKEIIEDKIKEYMTCTENSWIALYAEGTRYTKEKYETSLKFAKERNLEPLKHHLVPRGRGFATCIPILKKNNCKVMYNVQLSFAKDATNPPYLASLVVGKKLVAHVYIDRIPMEKVEPTFEYLYEIYKQKDALQDSFDKYGNFYEGRGLKVEEGYKMERRTCVLVNSICWLLFEAFMIFHYSMKMIEEDQVIKLTAIIVGVIGVCKS